MSKKIITLAMALGVVAGTATGSFALDCRGVAKAVDGTTVTVLCDNGKETTGENKGSSKIEVGDKVVVKDTRIKKAIDGC